MKKIFLLSFIFFTLNGAVFADCEYSCVKPYDMNSKFRSFSSSATGVNSIVEKKAESLLKKEILKFATAENIKLDLNSFSPKDLQNGRFKSMSLEAYNVKVREVYFSNLNLKTLCDFNYIKPDKNNIVFKEDFPMSFDVKMSQYDINRTIKNLKYQKIINDFNKLIDGFTLGAKVSSTRVVLKDDKFYFVVGVTLPFFKRELEIKIQADIKVSNGKIDYNHTHIASGNLKLDTRKLDFIMQYLNPLDFSVNILKNKDAQVIIKDIYVKDNYIYSNGIVVIPKN